MSEAELPDPTSLWNAAREAHNAGRAEQAAAGYRDLLALQPEHEGALHLLALLAHQRGDNASATTLLGRALAVAPQRAEHHGLLGIVALAAGDLDQAGDSLEAAIRIDPAKAELHYNLGMLRQRQGRFADAAQAYKATLGLAPGDAKALNNLGNVLRELENHEEAMACFEAALKATPASAPILMNLGLTRHRAGDPAGAVEAYRQALAQAPEQAVLHANLAEALRDLDQWDAAEAAYGDALARKPDFLDARLGLGLLKLSQGAPEAALAPLLACLDGQPGNQRAWAAKANALETLGRHEEARAILDLDRDVTAVALATPAGYSDLAAFISALVHDLQEDPAILWAGTGRATRHGLHSKNLYEAPTPRVSAMIAVLRQTIDGYIAALPRDSAHPFRGRVPADYHLHVWAVRMRAEGHQVSHIHPSGWLSGVTYLQLPAVLDDATAEGAANGAGWIEFGRPGYGVPSGDDWPVRRIKPALGQAFLFPSYAFHRTIPFRSETERISLAFDVVPRG